MLRSKASVVIDSIEMPVKDTLRDHSISLLLYRGSKWKDRRHNIPSVILIFIVPVVLLSGCGKNNFLTRDISKERKSLQSASRLNRNNPNPFLAVTIIHYMIPVKVPENPPFFTVSGQKLGTLVYGEQSADQYTLPSNTRERTRGRVSTVCNRKGVSRRSNGYSSNERKDSS